MRRRPAESGWTFYPGFDGISAACNQPSAISASAAPGAQQTVFSLMLATNNKQAGERVALFIIVLQAGNPVNAFFWEHDGQADKSNGLDPPSPGSNRIKYCEFPKSEPQTQVRGTTVFTRIASQ